MTRDELIEKLKKLPQNYKVRILNMDGYWDIVEVKVDEKYKEIEIEVE